MVPHLRGLPAEKRASARLQHFAKEDVRKVRLLIPPAQCCLKAGPLLAAAERRGPASPALWCRCHHLRWCCCYSSVVCSPRTLSQALSTRSTSDNTSSTSCASSSCCPCYATTCSHTSTASPCASWPCMSRPEPASGTSKCAALSCVLIACILAVHCVPIASRAAQAWHTGLLDAARKREQASGSTPFATGTRHYRATSPDPVTSAPRRTGEARPSVISEGGTGPRRRGDKAAGVTFGSAAALHKRSLYAVPPSLPTVNIGPGHQRKLSANEHPTPTLGGGSSAPLEVLRSSVDAARPSSGSPPAGQHGYSRGGAMQTMPELQTGIQGAASWGLQSTSDRRSAFDLGVSQDMGELPSSMSAAAGVPLLSLRQCLPTICLHFYLSCSLFPCHRAIVRHAAHVNSAEIARAASRQLLSRQHRCRACLRARVVRQRSVYAALWYSAAAGQCDEWHGQHSQWHGECWRVIRPPSQEQSKAAS